HHQQDRTDQVDYGDAEPDAGPEPCGHGFASQMCRGSLRHDVGAIGLGNSLSSAEKNDRTTSEASIVDHATSSGRTARSRAAITSRPGTTRRPVARQAAGPVRRRRLLSRPPLPTPADMPRARLDRRDLAAVVALMAIGLALRLAWASGYGLGDDWIYRLDIANVLSGRIPSNP